MKTIGIDLGSSSVKLTLFDAASGTAVASVQLPENEMHIASPKSGWAEQDPELWWKLVQDGIRYLTYNTGCKKEEIGAIGIAYQMHGLVCVDRDGKAVRDSIIWCDSRAVETGNLAFRELGSERVLSHLLNSPGNFTASKLAWVLQNEPAVYEKIHKFMLPGDFIAMKLTGETCTTVSGLSEGILWDFRNESPATFLLDHFGISSNLLPAIVPQFGFQGKLLPGIAAEMGLSPETRVTYRAGDQPNNAFSLNVLKPGEIAATAGTSGVVYGVTDQVMADTLSRVNTFLHVNHAPGAPRLGVLLCINGTGILNAWLRKQVMPGLSYTEMNALAAKVKSGSDGLSILPFGNGAERVLENRDTGCRISGMNFNLHSAAHLVRAAHEGIAFAFRYGMKVMEESGIRADVMRAGQANMFQSPVFAGTLSTTTGAEIQLYNTDGSLGAARGAAVGAGYYRDFEDTFRQLRVLETIYPDEKSKPALEEAYERWKRILDQLIHA